MTLFGTLDWGCLAVQCVLLLSMIVREMRKPKGSNLILILVSIAILGLVQVQTIWMFGKIQSSPTRITHLLHTITAEGARTANYLAAVFVICFCAVVYRMDSSRPAVFSSCPSKGPHESRISYAIALAWVLVVGGLLTALAGGIQAAVANPGQLIAGQTVLLILVTYGKVPMVRKIALHRPMNAFDVILFALTFCLLLINSRFLAAFAVLQLAVVVHYRRKEASPGVMLGLGACLLAIFIGFGLYREAAMARKYVPGFSTTEYISQSLASGQAFDWFYGSNVEGFAGLAGIITYEQDHGSLAHDYGVSNLTLIPQLVPNNIRNDPTLPFKGWSDELTGLYPYHGSVVPSGLEAAYAHFGAAGLALLGLLIGFLVVHVHRVLIESNEASVTASFVSVHLLSLVREMIWTAAFFALGEILMVWSYQKVLSFTAEEPAALPEAPDLQIS